MQGLTIARPAKKAAVLAAALAAAISLTGCYTPGERALGGAAIGGLGGAGIGALASGGMLGPTLAAGAVGAAGGALIGAATAPQPHYYGGYRRHRHYY